MNKRLLLICLLILIGYLLSLPSINTREYYINNGNKKQLKFIHIPKNAGTTIEDVAKENGIMWGRFDTEYNSIGESILKNNNINSENIQLLSYNKGSPWHNNFSLFPDEYKKKYDWFLVVRNPYDWILSHGHYWIKEVEQEDINNYTRESFNKYIQTKIKQQKNNPFGGHYTPQYKYSENNDSQLVNINVLKFENITNEFNNLMKEYNIDLHLNEHKNKSNYKFTTDDFTKETIDLIKKVYEQDFEQFNYNISNI
jgi:hypothetical protein